MAVILCPATTQKLPRKICSWNRTVLIKQLVYRIRHSDTYDTRDVGSFFKTTGKL